MRTLNGSTGGTGSPAGVSGKATKKEHGAGKRTPADRAADNLFRIVYDLHQHLSALADTKAHIMITLSALVAGVAATQLFDPLLQYAAAVLVVTCVLAAGFAVYATAPSLPARRAGPVTADRGVPAPQRSDLLFFSHFRHLPPDVFTEEIESLVRDRQEVHRALARDLHAMGAVLGRKKYRFLGYCYWTFMGGFALSAAILLLTSAAAWP